MMEEPLELSLKLKSIPVKLEQEDGTILHCILREPMGRDRDQYLTKLSGKIEIKEGQAVAVKNIGGIQAFLISLCLVYKDTNKPVGIEKVNKFPTGVQDVLFSKAQELAALGKDNEDKVGNG